MDLKNIPPIIFFLSLFLCSFGDAATYTCNSCSDCSSKINSSSPGDVVYLTANISTNLSEVIDMINSWAQG